MFEYEHQLRVRYAETDQMGYVYYGNYSTYYEVARAEALRSQGFSYKQLEQQGVMMPVFENYSKYLRPAKYDDILRIMVSVRERPGTRMTFHYEVFNEEDKVIHKGYTTLVFVDMRTGKPCPLPKVLAEIFLPYFDAKEADR